MLIVPPAPGVFPARDPPGSRQATRQYVGDGIARVYGVEKAMAMELLEFPGGVMGMVLNLEEDNVGVAFLGESHDIPFFPSGVRKCLQRRANDQYPASSRCPRNGSSLGIARIRSHTPPASYATR